MYNPFYKKHVRTLVDIFDELNEMTDYFQIQNLRPERMLVITAYELSLKLVEAADTIPLPKSALRAGRDVGDYAYLMAELLRPQAKPTKSMHMPTAREAVKYEEEKLPKAVRLNKKTFEKLLIYRAKASETIKYPAKEYKLAWEKAPEPAKPAEKQA